MARNEVFISRPPREVYELLSNPAIYSEWVVGAYQVRVSDEHYPEPGAEFEHRTTPLRLHDKTWVLAATPPVLLKLRARARPLPPATVTLQLQPEGQGTRLTMIEAPANPLLSLLAGPLGHGLLMLRNRESLRRLKEIAEGTRTPAQRQVPVRTGDRPAPRSAQEAGEKRG